MTQNFCPWTIMHLKKKKKSNNLVLQTAESSRLCFRAVTSDAQRNLYNLQVWMTLLQVFLLSDPRSTLVTPASVNNRGVCPSPTAMKDNSLTNKQKTYFSTHHEKVLLSPAPAGCRVSECYRALLHFEIHKTWFWFSDPLFVDLEATLDDVQ